VCCSRQHAATRGTAGATWPGCCSPFGWSSPARIGTAIAQLVDEFIGDCARLIAAARAANALPKGPPPRQTAAAYVAVLEAVAIQLAGRAPYDVVLTERAARGVLGLPVEENVR
jgi:hypothetical protein